MLGSRVRRRVKCKNHNSRFWKGGEQGEEQKSTIHTFGRVRRQMRRRVKRKKGQFTLLKKSEKSGEEEDEEQKSTIHPFGRWSRGMRRVRSKKAQFTLLEG